MTVYCDVSLSRSWAVAPPCQPGILTPWLPPWPLTLQELLRMWPCFTRTRWESEDFYPKLRMGNIFKLAISKFSLTLAVLVICDAASQNVIIFQSNQSIMCRVPWHGSSWHSIHFNPSSLSMPLSHSHFVSPLNISSRSFPLLHFPSIIPVVTRYSSFSLLIIIITFLTLLQDTAQSVERATPGEEVPGSIPAMAARSLLVGSVSV